jgi:Rieske Fe-S protein
MMRDAKECGRHLRDWPSSKSAGDLARGEACLLAGAGEPIAAWRDDAGALHSFAASCTHAGAVLHWNAAERTWDCPSHGSRFSGEDGRVIDGPAVTPLRVVEPPQE